MKPAEDLRVVAQQVHDLICMQSPKPTGITGKARETLAKILDHVLHSECLLSAKTRDYRWSVTGPNLYSLHRLLDEQRRQLDYWLDRVMERARSAGLPVPARSDGSSPAAVPGLPPRTMLSDLLSRHEAMAEQLRQDIVRLRDPGTADVLASLVEFHETTAWMLRMLHSDPGAGSGRTA